VGTNVRNRLKFEQMVQLHLNLAEPCEHPLQLRGGREGRGQNESMKNERSKQ